jgi:hypothetical protein
MPLWIDVISTLLETVTDETQRKEIYESLLTDEFDLEGSKSEIEDAFEIDAIFDSIAQEHLADLIDEEIEDEEDEEDVTWEEDDSTINDEQ